jgi:CIC family chloride channel protein
LLATSATVGSGAVGGIFTPTLLIGALLGGLLGHAAGAVWPNQIGGPEAYALVGMGGFLAATTRAPLMSMLMVFEMTLDYGVVLPLKLVSVTAYFTARRLDHDSIYSDSLRQKQSAQPDPEPLAMHVSDLMKPPPPSVRESAPFSEVARFFASHPYNSLQVVSETNRLRGVIVLHDVKNNLQETELTGVVTAFDLMHIHHHTATPETRLLDVLEMFTDHVGERLPVVNNAQEQLLIGSISKTDLMLTLAHRLQGAPRSP